MPRLLWLGLGALAGFWAATRSRGAAGSAGSKLELGSKAYGAGTASLKPPTMDLGSKAYPAGTASLPMDEQTIRDPKTVR